MEELKNIYSTDSVLVLDDAVYYTALYTGEGPFDKDHAYLDGAYFYLYRGKKSKDDMVKPGIYTDADTGETIQVVPITDDEKQFYTVDDGKIGTYDPELAAKIINEHDDLFIPISETSKVFNPEITVKDDILKRILKMVFARKDVDIDQYKDRFPDKNALFNFKQIMKGDGAVSMKIFQRICDVIGVQFDVRIREKDDGKPIGKPLVEDVIASSEDVFDCGETSE